MCARKVLVIIIAFIAVSVSAADKLVSRSSVRRLPEVESANKELMKSLKKEYQAASVTAESWADGNNYFIITRKDGTWARATEDGTVLSFADQSGQRWSFFRGCEFIRHSTGETNYIVLLPIPGIKVGSVVWSDGTIYNTQDKYKAFKVHNRVYYRFDRLAKAGTFDIYRLDGRKINGVPATDFYLARGGERYDVNSCGGKAVMAYPAGDDYVMFREKGGDNIKRWRVWTDETANYTFEGQPTMYRSLRVGDKPLAGGSISGYIGTMHHIHSNGMPAQTDTVVRMRLVSPQPLFRISDNTLLADSVDNIIVIKGTSKVLYGRTDSTGRMIRIGMTDLDNPSVALPQLFDDIYTAPDNTIYVRTDCSDPYTPYNPDYAYVPSPRNSDYSDVAGLVAQMGEDLSCQDLLHNMMGNDALFPYSPTRDGRLKWKTTPASLNLNDEEFISLYGSRVEEAATVAPGAVLLYDRLLNGFADLDSAYYAYADRKQERKEAYAEKMRIKKEREERMARARERIRELDAFQQQVAEMQSIVREGEARVAAREAAKRAAASGGSASGRSAAASTSSSDQEDTAGRKGFLRRQIAEWKNKLREAEDSYREVVSSGDDTWQKKNVIESKRKTVEECLEMIRNYEAELNSL